MKILMPPIPSAPFPPSSGGRVGMGGEGAP